MDTQALEHRLTVIEQDIRSVVRLGEQNAGVAQEILTQAKLTNGRVRELEKWKDTKEAYERGQRDVMRSIRRRDLFFLSLGGGAIALIAPKIVDGLWNWIFR